MRSGVIRGVLVAALLAPAAGAKAADADLSKKVDELARQVQELKSQAQASEPEHKPEWITFGGDLRVKHDVLRGKIPTYTLLTLPNGNPTFTNVQATTVKNDSVLTNRLGLNAHIRPMEGVTLNARILAYKVWGMADGGPTQAGFFADRQNTTFDGTVGHVPAGGGLVLDEAYATVKDILDYPVWFSAGRRPSTGGVPTNIREDRQVSGASGIPGLLVDYAFDGATLGAAPEIKALPGFAAKVCYGRAFESGFSQGGSATPRDTDMLGLSMLAYESADDRVDLQYQRGFHIMDSIPGPGVKANLGDIEEYGGSVIHAQRGVGPGDLTVFLSGAMSAAIPSPDRLNVGFGANNPGLMCDGTDCGYKAGYATYLGARYDFTKTKTKIGVEWNRGSKNWITFAPAGDDLWTSKLGTRGNVYEGYLIQDLGRAPIARDGRVLVRVGYQYYDFMYTGTNSWIGTPKSIKDLTLAQAQFMPPLRSATDVYTTFEVRF